MMEQQPNFFVRFFLAFAVALRFLFKPAFAARVLTLSRHPELDFESWANAQALPAAEREKKEASALPAPESSAQRTAEEPRFIPEKSAEAKKAQEPESPDSSSALQLLALFQREGRLLDFLMEDIAPFGDADVGAAARGVHEGCRKALAEYLPLEPVLAKGEGERVVVEPGFDPQHIRLTGNISGTPPFSGVLRHHGWRAVSVNLPVAAASHDSSVLAPAEVEL